jgi:hypothetical protein
MPRTKAEAVGPLEVRYLVRFALRPCSGHPLHGFGQLAFVQPGKAEARKRLGLTVESVPPSRVPGHAMLDAAISQRFDGDDVPGAIGRSEETAGEPRRGRDRSRDSRCAALTGGRILSLPERLPALRCVAAQVTQATTAPD